MLCQSLRLRPSVVRLWSYLSCYGHYLEVATADHAAASDPTLMPPPQGYILVSNKNIYLNRFLRQTTAVVTCS